MNISDKTYDFLKWLALWVIPAFETLWLTLAMAWDLPYAEPIGITIGAIGLFLASCIKISKETYEAQKLHDGENNVV